MALYHTVNGSPVEVKHIDYGTTVGYTKVGSPTISNGVVSGFTRNDSLRTSQSFTDSGQDFSMQFSINNFTQATDVNPIVSNYESSIGGNYFAIVINSPGASSYPNGFSARIKGTALAVQSTHTIDYTKSYRLLFQRVSGVYTLKVYQDGTLVDTQQLVSSELLAGGTAFTFNIGANNYWFSVGFSGSIDINETYIKVNGKLWFFRPSTNYLVKDDKLVFADQGLYLTGPVNYTVVGSPTIMDGIASGFSRNDHLQISNGFSLNTAYEMVVGFSVSDLTGGGNLCTFQATNNITYGLYVSANAELTFYSPVGTLLNSATGAILTNKNYKAKYIMDGVNQSLYLDEGNGYVLQETSSVRSSEHSINYFDLGGGGTYLKGSIYLKETYIKVDDQLWFYEKNYASKNIAPVPAGYTYGTTTTSSIGYVDMRTQQFTAAPSGATIGRDE